MAEAGSGGSGCCSSTGSPARRRTSPTASTPSPTAGWHVVAPDLRGHGASGQPADEYGLLAGDLRRRRSLALADDLGWDRFALLGHSMGGMVAQVLALAGARPRSVPRADGHRPTARSSGIDPELAALAVEIVRTEGIDRLMEVMTSSTRRWAPRPTRGSGPSGRATSPSASASSSPAPRPCTRRWPASCWATTTGSSGSATLADADPRCRGRAGHAVPRRVAGDGRHDPRGRARGRAPTPATARSSRRRRSGGTW